MRNLVARAELPPMAFVLSIDPPQGGPDLQKELLGLTIPLRLALTAQASGAVAVVAPDEAVAATLRDPRLTIPVVAARPSGELLPRERRPRFLVKTEVSSRAVVPIFVVSSPTCGPLTSTRCAAPRTNADSLCAALLVSAPTRTNSLR